MKRSVIVYPLLDEILISLGFRWSDKRSFSIFVEDKKLSVRRTKEIPG